MVMVASATLPAEPLELTLATSRRRVVPVPEVAFVVLRRPRP